MIYFGRWFIWYVSILVCFYVFADSKNHLHSHFIVLLCHQYIMFFHITSNSCLIISILHQLSRQGDDYISQYLLHCSYLLVIPSIIQICIEFYLIISEFVSDMYVSMVGFIWSVTSGDPPQKCFQHKMLA